MLLDDKKTEDASIVKDFMKSPIFGITPHTNEIICDGKRWLTGVTNPLQRSAGRESPTQGLTIEHAEVLMGIMSFQPTAYHFTPNENSNWKFSLKKLSESIYGGYNSRYSDHLKLLLADLVDCWSSMYNEKTKETHYFRVLEKVSIVSRPSRRNDRTEELWLDNIQVHETYTRLISSLTTSLMIDISLFRDIRSKVAKAIYMYMPSRAIYHNEDEPFRIKLSTLFRDLAVDGKKAQRRSGRKQIMKQGKKSIIEQLDKARITRGIFRCKLLERPDMDDDLFLCWVEQRTTYVTATSKTGEFFTTDKDGLQLELDEWARIVEESNKIEIPEYIKDRLEKYNLDRGGEWQCRVFILLLGEFYFETQLASYCDADCGFGVIVNHFREILLSHQKDGRLRKF